eukprot:Tamp_30506.p1 GENE.Tamp_30506~~Tamp_30506.p1  ORF type:complete len:202 (-),score=14.97 Tamp_30506:45-650(-)
MSSHGGKKANLAKFHERAIAISQDKNEDGTRAAITAVIIGGGPAGMIAALALVHAGLRVIICEEQPAFTVDEPEAGQAHGPSEPLVLSAHSVSQLCEWGMPKRDLDGIVSPALLSSCTRPWHGLPGRRPQLPSPCSCLLPPASSACLPSTVWRAWLACCLHSACMACGLHGRLQQAHAQALHQAHAPVASSSYTPLCSCYV